MPWVMLPQVEKWARAYGPRFFRCFQYVSNEEMGYAKVKGDPGGETYRGITKRDYSRWRGWKIIDGYRPHAKNNRALAQILRHSVQLQKAVTDFYFQRWSASGAQGINNLAVAERLFSLEINAGKRQAGLCFQRACRANGKSVTEDGRIGRRTAKAANTSNRHGLLAALRSEMAGFYRVLVALKPYRRKFIRGWLIRAYR